MTDIALPKLPDTRSTARLLKIIDNLERMLANGATLNSQSATATDSELAQLRAENKRLKRQIANTVSRVDDLILRLEHTPASAPSDNRAEAA